MTDNQIDLKKIARNSAIARLSKFIEKYLYNVDWTLLSDMAGVGHLLDQIRHERVRKAQRFGDPDYPSAVSSFLQEVFDVNEQVGLFLVGEIIQQENPYDDPLSEQAKEELTQILAVFGSEDIGTAAPIFPATVKSKFIDVIWIPDDFYEKLIVEINHAYDREMPISLSILIRKLLENLVIDILRKKYGTSHLNLYYDPSRRRFNDFSVLLQNLDARKADLHYITSSLDHSFVTDLNRFRETGNSGAHSIDTNLTIEQFAAEKANINYIVKLLLRIFQRL